MWSDLERPPLRQQALARALVVEGGLWRELRVVARTGSTNADVLAAARAGARQGLVVIAEEQTSGRGRLGRTWSAPPRSALTFSVLLRPPPHVARARWAWLPLLTGLAVVDALGGVCEVDAQLKWPNDVLVDGRKLAGVLAEATADAVVVGVGLNVSLRTDELPVPTATSLALAGAATVDRDTVLRAALRALQRRYLQWCDSAGAGDLPTDYRSVCVTIGGQVRVELPGDRVVNGLAVSVDDDGQLVVRGDDGEVIAVAAGDVVHVACAVMPAQPPFSASEAAGTDRVPRRPDRPPGPQQ